jgi:crotonobetainyl-CoA:carnitine CoA-transferase CaiB-like acyl-CoA transferase
VWGFESPLAHVNRLLQEVLPVLGLSDDSSVQLDEADWLPARLPVGELAVGSVAAAGLAGLAVCRGARARVDARQVAVAFSSERYTTIDGRPIEAFAPLSGFFRTADGWVRTHGNYPHHRAALARVLGLAPDATTADAAAALRDRAAQDVEDLVTAAGGIAVRVRTTQEWFAGAQGRAVDEHPLLACESIGEAAPVPLPERPRVLDLTRVIAGPVASRTLSYLGCDVLRVDPPRHPEISWQHVDTSGAKRSTLLDLAEAGDRERFETLLASADVLLSGYRPGALTAYGLDPPALAERYPRLVQASLSAWTPSGPWGGRRGFDSIVQAATGVSLVEAADGELPGALPAQALDHATGYLVAAGICSALHRRADEGGSWRVSAHLARTAHWLLRAGRRAEPSGPVTDVEGLLQVSDTPSGVVVHPRPALAVDSWPVEFPMFGGRYGADPPEWLQPSPVGGLG